MPLSDRGTVHLKKRVTCKYTEWTRLKDTCEFHRTLKDGGDSTLCDNENIRKCEPCTNGPWSPWERRESASKCESRRWRNVYSRENETQVTCSEENEDSHCNDCALGEWTSWVKDIGKSTKSTKSRKPCFEQRVRPVLIYPSSGGYACEKTNDSRACSGGGGSGEDGLSAPSIAGITIGASILLIAVIVFICCCLKSAWRNSSKSGDTSKMDSTSKSNSNSNSAARRRKKSDPERRKSIRKPTKPVSHPAEEVGDYYTAPVVTEKPRESKVMIITANESKRYKKADDPGAESVYLEIYKLDCDVGYETGSEFNPIPLEFTILADNGYSETTYLEPNKRQNIKHDRNVVYASPHRKNSGDTLSNVTRAPGPYSSHDELTRGSTSENESNSIDYSTPQNDETYDVLNRPRITDAKSSSGISNPNYHKISTVVQEMKERSNSPSYSIVEINVNPNHVEDNDDHFMRDITIGGVTNNVRNRAKLETPSDMNSRDYHVLECDNLTGNSNSDRRVINSNNNNNDTGYRLMKMDTWRDGDVSMRGDDNSADTVEARKTDSVLNLEVPVLTKLCSKDHTSSKHKVHSISRSTKF